MPQSSIPVAQINKQDIFIEAFGRKWHLHRTADLEQLWESMNEADFEDERIPYWAELWPSSLTLAYWLNENRDSIAHKACLDIGCGLGFTTLFAASLNARVFACDYELAALQNCALNTQLNCTPSPAWICMDWRRPALAALSLDFIWGGDIIYENRSMMPVLDLLRNCLAPTGIAWIAEPGRAIFRDFPVMANKFGFTFQKVFVSPVLSLYGNSPGGKVTIWEARRAVSESARHTGQY